MTRLSWADKLNNRLKRNWNIEIDYSKCFTADACGKRSYYTHGEEHPISDDIWYRIYKEITSATKKDSVTIEYIVDYNWNEDYEYAYRNETEYYGYCNGFVLITVKTPTGRNKIKIDSRYV